jgi:GntP family gluconate:H+ symporter
MTVDALLPLAAGDLVEPVASGWHLVIAALAGIGLIVVLITVVKMHPFLALILGGLTVGVVAGQDVNSVIASFTLGFGTTAAGVGALIALGAMFAKLLADSGGADQIVDTIVGRASGRTLPWAMALVGAIIGLPMFFEIGLVLLMPVIYLVARRAQVSLITVGIPALAGLSAMHGFVPPHPGPVTAIDLLDANLGVTLGLGLLVAIPTIIVAGPLFGSVAGRWVVIEAPRTFDADERESDIRPTFGVTLATVLLPVVLMLLKAVADIWLDKGTTLRTVLDAIGTPLFALLVAVVVAMFTLGLSAGFGRERIASIVTESLPPIAGILLIVGAGGGFKQTLIDSGVGKTITQAADGANISALLLGWLVAVGIRLATGSATVATISAAGIVAPLAAGMSTSHTALLVLAIGSGSLFFSHVNDAGFWLVKEFFGMSVGQTLKSWSVMETIISVVSIVFILLLNLVL